MMVRFGGVLEGNVMRAEGREGEGQIKHGGKTEKV